MWEVCVRPADDIVIIFGCGDGRVSRTLMRDWATRFGGETVKPFVSEKWGIPPDRLYMDE